VVVAIASLGAIGFATLLPQGGTAAESHLCIVCGPFGGVSAILNVLLFVPLGISLAMVGVSPRRAIVLMVVTSALIETAQLLIIPGRNATIGDVLANGLGGALAFVFARNSFQLLRPSRRMSAVLTAGWCTIWLAIQTASAFGFSPSFPRSRYYGQIARHLGDYEPFNGHVYDARIADVRVPDMQFDNSVRVRQLLLGAATATITISPPRSAQPMTPIVRIADDSEREILVFAQNGADILFGVRTGASALHLRPPTFALTNVFAVLSPDGNEPITNALRVSAAYSSRDIWITVQSAASHTRRVQITTALGWTMVLPFQWIIEGTSVESVACAVWIACLLIPLGYWGAWLVQLRRADAGTRIFIVAVPMLFLLLFVGLIVAPKEFGLRGAPLQDWLAALTGIVAGATAATRLAEPDKALD
jgi:hypothetical protein